MRKKHLEKSRDKYNNMELELNLYMLTFWTAAACKAWVCCDCEIIAGTWNLNLGLLVHKFLDAVELYLIMCMVNLNVIQ